MADLGINEIKAIVISSLFTIGVICVILPRFISKIPESYRDTFVSLAQAGSGGVFLAAAMVDMFPGALQDWFELLPDEPLLSAQISCIIFIFGFILIFFIEKIVFVGLLEPRTEIASIPKGGSVSKFTSEDLTSDYEPSNIQEKEPLKKKKHAKNNSSKNICNHSAFSVDCLTDHEDYHDFSLHPGAHEHHHGDDCSITDAPLDPIDVLTKTLSHGFQFVPASKSDKVKIALDLVEG